MSFISKLTCSLMCIVLLVGCVSSRPVKSVVNSSCEPPCWHQIVPYQSTGDEAKSILDNSSIIDHQDWERTGNYNVQPGILIITRGLANGPGQVKVIVTDNKVTHIEVKPNTETLVDFVERFGKPDYYYAIDTSWPPDHKELTLVFFDLRGFVYDIRISNPPAIGFSIEANMPVDRAFFSESSWMKYRLTDPCMTGYIFSWTGYSAVTKIIPHDYFQNCKSP